MGGAQKQKEGRKEKYLRKGWTKELEQNYSPRTGHDPPVRKKQIAPKQGLAGSYEGDMTESSFWIVTALERGTGALNLAVLLLNHDRDEHRVSNPANILIFYMMSTMQNLRKKNL